MELMKIDFDKIKEENICGTENFIINTLYPLAIRNVKDDMYCILFAAVDQLAEKVIYLQQLITAPERFDIDYCKSRGKISENFDDTILKNLSENKLYIVDFTTMDFELNINSKIPFTCKAYRIDSNNKEKYHNFIMSTLKFSRVTGAKILTYIFDLLYRISNQDVPEKVFLHETYDTITSLEIVKAVHIGSYPVKGKRCSYISNLYNITDLNGNESTILYNSNYKQESENEYIENEMCFGPFHYYRTCKLTKHQIILSLENFDYFVDGTDNNVYIFKDIHIPTDANNSKYIIKHKENSNNET